MRVLITGATGLVGQELVPLLLRNGFSIHYLTTDREKITSRLHYTGFFWNPENGEIDEAALIGVDAIVHLAGASIGNRWTESYKEEIIESRVLSASILYKMLKKHPHQVRQIVSASAIGIYADSPEKIFTESSADFDQGFLGHVVRKWESGADMFQNLGIAVCKIRTGIVLSEKGGALPELIKPIDLNLGAAFGSGRQWQSWIHIADLAAIYVFAIQEQLQGVFNAVAPHPISNSQFIRAIALTRNKILWLPHLPRWLMRLLLGEMHQVLFTSQRVSAEKIIAAGYRFRFEHLWPALNDLLKNKKTR
jgi:uncharacterized protein (TIGR01777 family)